MDEPQVLSFAMWSVIAAVLMLATGFAYRAHSGKRDDEIPAS